MNKNLIFTLISFILAFIISYYHSKKINYIFIVYLIITFFIFYTIFFTIDSSTENFKIKKFRNVTKCKYVRDEEKKNDKNSDINSSNLNCNESTISINTGGIPIISNKPMCTNKKNFI